MNRRGLCAAAVAGILSCAVGSTARADEAKAIAAIEKAGGKVKRDDSKPGKPVTEVSFESSKTLKDDDLKSLREFKQLEELFLSGSTVTDAGLAHLKGNKTINGIGLLNTAITDKGLDHLKGLKSLGRVNIIGTKVTKAGVESLKKSRPDLFVIDEP